MKGKREGVGGRGIKTGKEVEERGIKVEGSWKGLHCMMAVNRGRS